MLKHKIDFSNTPERSPLNGKIRVEDIMALRSNLAFGFARIPEYMRLNGLNQFPDATNINVEALCHSLMLEATEYPLLANEQGKIDEDAVRINFLRMKGNFYGITILAARIEDSDLSDETKSELLMSLSRGVLQFSQAIMNESEFFTSKKTDFITILADDASSALETIKKVTLLMLFR